MPRILAGDPELVGVTIPFREQLYEALVVLRELRAARPDLPLVVGGPSVDIWAALLCEDPRPFALYDYAVRGDGACSTRWRRATTCASSRASSTCCATTASP